MALFSAVAELAEELASEAGKLKKRAAIVRAISSVHAAAPESDDAGLFALYLAGTPFAEADARKLNAGGALLSKALLAVSRANGIALTAAYRRHGDMGSAAFDLLMESPKFAGKKPELRLVDVGPPKPAGQHRLDRHPFAEGPAEQFGDLSHRPGDVDRGRRQRGAPREGQQPLGQRSGALGRRELARAEASEPLLDRGGREGIPDQRLGFAARGCIAGDEDDRHAPVAAEGGVDAGLADERAVEAEALPRLARHRVREDAVGDARHSVHPDEERGVAARLEERGVLRPFPLHDVLAGRIEELGDE